MHKNEDNDNIDEYCIHELISEYWNDKLTVKRPLKVVSIEEFESSGRVSLFIDAFSIIYVFTTISLK